MASYNGNIDLLSLNGAQVFKGIDSKNPERVYVCIPADLNEIKVEQPPDMWHQPRQIMILLRATLITRKMTFRSNY